MSRIDPKDFYLFDNDPSPAAEDAADADYAVRRDHYLRSVLGDDMADTILAQPVEKAEHKKRKRKYPGQEQLRGDIFHDPDNDGDDDLRSVSGGSDPGDNPTST